VHRQLAEQQSMVLENHFHGLPKRRQFSRHEPRNVPERFVALIMTPKVCTTAVDQACSA
jgi:hypothetical protein